MAAGDTEIVLLSQDPILAPSLGSMTHWSKKKHRHNNRVGLWTVFGRRRLWTIRDQCADREKRTSSSSILSSCHHLKTPFNYFFICESIARMFSSGGQAVCVCVCVLALWQQTQLCMWVYTDPSTVGMSCCQALFFIHTTLPPQPPHPTCTRRQSETAHATPPHKNTHTHF